MKKAEVKGSSYPIWHPYTQMYTHEPPIKIVKGDGTTLYTEAGDRFIDAISSWWVNIHGHAHPYVAKKIYEQASSLEHVIFAGFTHDPAQDLCQKLLKILPDNQAYFFFSDNGSTAVEVGLKMAFQYFYNRGEAEKRNKVIAFHDAYHGDTFGAMSVSGRSAFTDPFSKYLFDVEYLPLPLGENKSTCFEQLERLVATQEVAAFIFEPLVQGAGGMNMYAPEDLDRMIAICQSNDVICIADEVMTGFGRTGKYFASLYLENQPDIMCLSKGLTAGFLPMSLTTCTPQIYEAFLSEDKLKTFFHGHSYTANPIACAAAIASYEILTDPAYQNRIQEICDQQAAFKAEMAEHASIKNTRVRGTIVALEFQTGEETGYLNNKRDQIYNFCLERGVLLRPLGNVLYCMPPYCISDEELKKVHDCMRELADQWTAAIFKQTVKS